MQADGHRGAGHSRDPEEVHVFRFVRKIGVTVAWLDEEWFLVVLYTKKSEELTLFFIPDNPTC